MLMEDKIARSQYFSAIRMTNPQILDPLTKTICRKCILNYAKYLIKNRVPFVMGIMDIDNFKTFNDTYGHAVGDEVLKITSENAMNAMDRNGWLGRYGGDEFLYIYEGYSKYEDSWEFAKQLYVGVRTPETIRNNVFHITCTTGAACYPSDAESFEGLFELCDKCLYRGKVKGRNCYICYVESKHKDIVVQKNGRGNFLEKIEKLYDAMDNADKKKKIVTGMSCITEILGISGVTYWNRKKTKASFVCDVNYGDMPGVPDRYLEDLRTKKSVKVNDYRDLKESDPLFYNYCYENNLLSFIVIKTDVNERDPGYVMFYDSDFERIWQDEDEALLLIFARTIQNYSSVGLI